MLDLALEPLMVIACLLLVAAFVVIRLLQTRGNASQRDSTDRKRLENRLEESQALFSGALDASNVDIAILNAEGRILFVKEAWSTLANDNKNKANHCQVGCNYFDIVNTDDPAQRDAAHDLTAEKVSDGID